ncbi:MAG TPA: proline--tRNA ligase [Candidatus Omnitrophota bacterium]|jgi:prolyl-tRNA synthetase|nr:MAG: Proline--tRNA ligase [Candidatus Omnitrophica bacterium ADurb.Bin314]HOE68873.1 proline--tRNA ligase [Candidatus Omnitrophota bacterium]HQB94554.1 proline--tRNA ligase [Candidatus Omnitrophota bacterium]
MRWTQILIPSLRNVPKDAEAASHQLALRAGLVRQLASGVYSYLPLGFRVLLKIIGIIREEMNRAGACEVLMPALHPAELWKKSGRYETLGEDKIVFKNRAGHEFVLGPTHEEVITDLVGTNIKSFRDLPLNLYQIQNKFRDEARPRFGVIRTKEFIMKDAYSFDRDEAGLDVNYRKMSEAYHRIFSRCGLQFQVVSADTGMMGGKMSQEFMVICPYGEDRVASSGSGYLASQDIAERGDPGLKTPVPQSLAPEKFDTPNLRTIEEITHKYKVPAHQMIKTLIFMADDKPVAALVTGENEVNEGKLRKLIGAKTIRQAEAHEIRDATGAPVGFAGPIGLKIPVYADWDVIGIADGVTGANEEDKHFRNVTYGRDFTPTATGDIRFVKDGDRAPDGSGTLKLTTSMEIGHIFKLGTRYSESVGAHFLDEKGERKPVIMGCYGIGVNRILASAIEQNHDAKGIKWPAAIAPFAVEIITVNQAEEKVAQAAGKIYAELTAAGIEVLYDDRNERAGVKFNDADLIGIPKQIVIGERNLAQGKVEVKDRSTGAVQQVDLHSVVSSFS